MPNSKTVGDVEAAVAVLLEVMRARGMTSGECIGVLEIVKFRLLYGMLPDEGPEDEPPVEGGPVDV